MDIGLPASFLSGFRVRLTLPVSSDTKRAGLIREYESRNQAMTGERFGPKCELFP